MLNLFFNSFYLLFHHFYSFLNFLILVRPLFNLILSIFLILTFLLNLFDPFTVELHYSSFYLFIQADNFVNFSC
jgi:hypothetical protein